MHIIRKPRHWPRPQRMDVWPKSPHNWRLRFHSKWLMLDLSWPACVPSWTNGLKFRGQFEDQPDNRIRLREHLAYVFAAPESIYFWHYTMRLGHWFCSRGETHQLPGRTMAWPNRRQGILEQKKARFRYQFIAFVASNGINDERRKSRRTVVLSLDWQLDRFLTK